MADSSFLSRLADQVQLHANAKQVFGEPVERDGTTIIPVANVQWGFGGGALGRLGTERGGGGGGGARAYPSGYITLRDGRAEFHPIADARGALALAAAGGIGLLAGLILRKLLRG